MTSNCTAISGTTGGRDLALTITRDFARTGVLYATWVAEFAIDIRSRGRGSGSTLSWQVVSRIEGVRQRVVWDFASEGTLEFTCSDLELRETLPVAPSSTSDLAMTTNATTISPPVEPPTFQVKKLEGWDDDVHLWADPCGAVIVKVVDARWGDPVELSSSDARELAKLLIEAADECDA